MVENQFDQDQTRAKWTDLSTKVFADLMVEQIQQGNRPNNVFNKKAWKHIREEFNKQTNLKFDRQQLKNHLDVLRKRYNHIKAILDHSGFTWDATQCMLIAHDDVWQKYIEAHPEADSIRKKGCHIFNELCIIFSEAGTVDKCVLSSLVTDKYQMSQDQSRAKWTTSIEKIFIELMLEQVLQGSRLNNGFSKKAWKYICEEFNKRTGQNFDKQQLKNRHGVLRRLYNNIKLLLEQNGFYWDKSQCLVVADDELWAKYIKEHPEIEAIKGKECTVFEKLDRIFTESGFGGKYALSDQQPTINKMNTNLSEDPFKQDQSRAKWTTSLDKTFVDLLIEQTQQNSVSAKRAWKQVREEFSKRTGLDFDEQQLRNHQSILRKLYNNIKSVIDQNGFRWNDCQHMVMADDEVWENYIKEHPEAETIRTKECPIFKQLCMLFSDPGDTGIHIQSSHEMKSDHDVVTLDTPEATSMSAEPVENEASSPSSEEGDLSDGRNKRCNSTPVSSNCNKRIHTETTHLATAVLEVASTTNKRAVLTTNREQFSISACIKILNEMEGIDQDLYLAAVDLFQDPDKRETFVSIKVDIRLAWLKGKCNAS